MVHPFVTRFYLELEFLCNKHQVKKMYVFGSATTGFFDETKSDIDFLVEFKDGIKPEEVGRHLWDMQHELEGLFQRKVDLLLNRPFRNAYFTKSVEASKQVLYAA